METVLTKFSVTNCMATHTAREDGRKLPIALLLTLLEKIAEVLW